MNKFSDRWLVVAVLAAIVTMLVIGWGMTQ